MHQEHWEAASTRWIELAEFPNRARQPWPGDVWETLKWLQDFLRVPDFNTWGTLLLWFHSVFVIVKESRCSTKLLAFSSMQNSNVRTIYTYAKQEADATLGISGRLLLLFELRLASAHPLCTPHWFFFQGLGIHIDMISMDFLKWCYPKTIIWGVLGCHHSRKHPYIHTCMGLCLNICSWICKAWRGRWIVHKNMFTRLLYVYKYIHDLMTHTYIYIYYRHVYIPFVYAWFPRLQDVVPYSSCSGVPAGHWRRPSRTCSWIVQVTKASKWCDSKQMLKATTVDGWNPATVTSWYGWYTSIYRVLYIPGGCLGFLPSTVLWDNSS